MIGFPLVLWIVLAAVGFSVKGPPWLGYIAAVLSAATAGLGWTKRKTS